VERNPLAKCQKSLGGRRQEGEMAYSRLLVRCFEIGNVHTTVALEVEFWEILEEICQWEGKTPSTIIREIDLIRNHGSRASAIRIFIVRYLRSGADFGMDRPADSFSPIVGATFFQRQSRNNPEVS
jgi:predicted DNA-binding ribbon-helix-helix protein